MSHIIFLVLMVAGAVAAYNEQLISTGIMTIGLFVLAYGVSMHYLLRD